MRRPIVFTNKGQQILGVLHCQPQAQRLPAVLILHGFTGTKVESHRIFVKLAELLAQRSMVALRIDFRGSGDSEGDFSQMTLEGEISDAEAAIDYMQTLPEVDPGRIAILGLSMGGAVAASLAGRDSRPVACALWSAVADFSRTFFAEAASRVLERGEETMNFGGNVVSREFLLQCRRAQPHLELAKRKLPVLIVHGAADQTVPRSQAELFRASAQKAGGPVEFHIIPEADHTYTRRDWEEKVLLLSADWLAKQIL